MNKRNSLICGPRVPIQVPKFRTFRGEYNGTKNINVTQMKIKKILFFKFGHFYLWKTNDHSNKVNIQWPSTDCF